MTTAVQQLLGDLKAIAEHLGELVSSLDPPATGDLKNDLSHLRTLSAEAVLALEQATSSSAVLHPSSSSRELGALCIRTKTHIEDATRAVKSLGARRWYHKLRTRQPNDDMHTSIEALRTCIDQAYALCHTTEHVAPSPASASSSHHSLHASREASHTSVNASRQPSSRASLGSLPSSPSLLLNRSRTQGTSSEEPPPLEGSMSRWPSISGAVRGRASRSSSGLGHAEAAPLCVIRDGKVFSEVTCVLYVPAVGSYQGGVWISVKTKALGTNKLLWHNVQAHHDEQLQAPWATPVTVMARDQRYLWMGHEDGVVVVWHAHSKQPLTQPYACFRTAVRSLCVDPGTGHAWVGSDDGTLRCMLVQRVGRRSCRLASVRVATVFGAPAVDSGDKGDEVDEATMAAALHDVPIAPGEAPADAFHSLYLTHDGGPAHAYSVTSMCVWRGHLWSASAESSTHRAPTLKEWSVAGHLQSIHLVKVLGPVRCMSVMERVGTAPSPPVVPPKPPPKRTLTTVDSMHRPSFGPGPDDAAAWLLTGHVSGAVQLWEATRPHTATPVCCFGSVKYSVLSLQAVPAYQAAVAIFSNGQMHAYGLPESPSGEVHQGLGQQAPEGLLRHGRLQVLPSATLAACRVDGVLACDRSGQLVFVQGGAVQACMEGAGMEAIGRLDSRGLGASFVSGLPTSSSYQAEPSAHATGGSAVLPASPPEDPPDATPSVFELAAQQDVLGALRGPAVVSQPGSAMSAGFSLTGSEAVDCMQQPRNSSASAHTLDGTLDAQWIIPAADLKWQPDAYVGDGSFATVYQGVLRGADDVAVKVLKSGTDPQELRSMTREISIIKGVRHPNCLMFLGICLEPKPALVMEFCDRHSLFDCLSAARAGRDGGELRPWWRRLNIALDAAKGMAHLHSLKPAVVHRDLKSPNLMVAGNWTVKVGDFGLSRILDSETVSSSTLQPTNPRWLAPEVIRDQSFGPASDVFAFAIILWELLTFEMPYGTMRNVTVLNFLAGQDGRPALPADLNTVPGGPFEGIQEYVDLMQACWATSPAARPSFVEIVARFKALVKAEEAARRGAHERAQPRPTSPQGPDPSFAPREGPAAAQPLAPVVLTLQGMGSSQSPFSAIPDNASFLLDDGQVAGGGAAQPNSLRAGGAVSSNTSVVSSPFTDGSEAHGVVGAAPSDLDDEFAALVLTGQAKKAGGGTGMGQGAGAGSAVAGERAGGVPANLRGFVDEAEGEEEEGEHPQSLSFGNWR